MARTSNATQLSTALTRAEQAETALADARAQIALLEEKLTLARSIFVEQRTAIRALRATRAARGTPTPAQRAYQQRAAAGRAQHAAQSASNKAAIAAFYEAHPDAKSAPLADVLAWFNQPAPVECE